MSRDPYSSDQLHATETTPRSRFRETLLLLGGLTLLLGWAYWPTLQSMVHRWSVDPKYSHGFLVPVFAAIVLWARRAQYEKIRFSINWWGLAFILGGCLLRVLAAMLFFEFLDIFSVIPTLLGICVLLGSWAALRWAWPGVLFLVFMMPAPHQIDTTYLNPLSPNRNCFQYLSFANIWIPRDSRRKRHPRRGARAGSGRSL